MFFIPVYIFILIFTILVDYFAALQIEKSKRYKKRWLIASITANIGTLFIFKYYNFFIHDFNAALNTHWILLNVVLPIGLSFHTFQALSYTIEVYKGNYKAEKHLGIYALYVMFYPQLVAGPIERPQHLLPQLKKQQYFNWQNILDGLRLMLWGFFKKVVIADRLSAYVSAIFNQPGQYSVANIWLGVFFFAIQIYCDFSGYSDIAIGSAKTMGFDLMLNFNRPYFSVNLREYWHRWHISLSSWFRDYVYKPLGGSYKTNAKTILNIMIVFVLSGFWHGAGWNFITWGALNGAGLIIYTFITKRFSLKNNFGLFVGWVTTMIFIFFGWVFFRAVTFDNAISVIKNMFGKNKPAFTVNILSNNFSYGKMNLTAALLCIISMFIVERKTDPRLLLMNRYNTIDILFCVTTVLLILFLGIFTSQGFIYFQF